jgi:hypothetical protein
VGGGGVGTGLGLYAFAKFVITGTEPSNSDATVPVSYLCIFRKKFNTAHSLTACMLVYTHICIYVYMHKYVHVHSSFEPVVLNVFQIKINCMFITVFPLVLSLLRL